MLALAYEKLDKIVLSVREFEQVKSLDPGNRSASEGLSRLHKVIHQDDDLKKSLARARSQEQSIEKEKAPIQKSVSAVVETSSQEKKAPVEAKVETQTDTDTEFKQLEEQKLNGNNFFKESNSILITIN